MAEITLTLNDGRSIQFEKGASVKEVLDQLGVKMDKSVFSAKLDDIPIDLNHPLEKDARLEALTFDSEEGREIYRHSTSHLMAHAVKELFSEAKITIGPAIKNGFYYDFDMEQPFSPEDLERIGKKMKKIAQRNLPFQRLEVSKEEARKLFKEQKEPYKIELLEEIDEEQVTLYRQGEFIDLCRGPHVPSTGWLSSFKLLSVAGAYWKGDEHNKMLQRIYGTSFPNREELDRYLSQLEEAKKRDHRILGKQLDLFSLHEEIGPGLIHWHPKGAIIRNIIEDFWKKEHSRHGYQQVYTPHIASKTTYQTSGHLESYKENMYAPMEIDGVPYWVKPMNCPGHIMIYQTRLRSYRDLPIRYAELGTVYRYERGGVLHGMLRVRGFTQDDAHIFCTPEQMADEIAGVLGLVDVMMKTFGYSYHSYLATRPEKSLGSEELWQRAIHALAEALERHSMRYNIDPGGGVFYGPKIDIKLWDALGREWQGPTIQVDFNLPERFNILYTGPDGARHHAVMIHRTVLGSMERFIGGLIEHYAGAFPLWLAPSQVVILTITSRQIECGKKVEEQLKKCDIRVETDFRNEKIGYKIREAQLAKIPYMAVIGGREMTSDTVSIRTRQGKDMGPIKLESLVEKLHREIEAKQ